MIVRTAAASSPPPASTFPLSIAPGGRYLQTAAGAPYLLIGDALWSLEVQPSVAQITTILQNRAAKGYNCILMEAFERLYSDHSPAWANAAGDIPFTTTANSSSMTWTSPVEAYWAVNDHIVNTSFDLGMTVIFNPAYGGYGGTGTADGWRVALNAASDADLVSYGSWLASRYNKGNVIWCAGGDDAGDGGVSTPGSDRDKQWKIFEGIRAVRSTDLITGHTARAGNSGAATDGDAYAAWGTYTGFNLPNIYGRTNASDMYSLAATAYARNLPFFMIEGPYENDGDSGGTSANMRKAMWQALLSGACGAIGGEFPRWALGAAGAGGSGIADCIANHLNTSGDADCGYMAALLGGYQWHLLEPKTDTSLVTTSLGTGASRICGARASDGSFAMIYTPSANFTVSMAALASSSVRGRWYNPTTGAFATATGSPFANTGTQAFTAPGERVLVLDAA